MPFTPEEIESKEFLSVLRGFDKEQVAEFLRAIAVDVRKLTDRLARAEEAAAKIVTDETERSTDDYSRMGTEVAVILRSAHEGAEQTRKLAEKEAEERRAAAILEANERLRVAREQSQATRALAETETTKIRQEAEAQRVALIKQGEEILRRAEERAKAVRAKAEEEAGARLEAATKESDELVGVAVSRYDALKVAEGELRHRLNEAMRAVQKVTSTLDAPATDNGDATAPRPKAGAGAGISPNGR